MKRIIYIVIPFVVILLQGTVHAQSTPQSLTQLPDDSIKNYITQQLRYLAGQADMEQRKKMTFELVQTLKPVANRPALAAVINQVRFEDCRMQLVDGNYPAFRADFDLLPQSLQDFLISSGTSYLLKMPEAREFTFDRLEKLVKEKQRITDSAAKAAAPPTDRWKRMNADDYHYLVLSLAAARNQVGQLAQARQQLPALQKYFQTSNIGLNQLNTSITEQTWGADSATALLEKFVSTNKFNDSMMHQLKRLYQAKKGSDKDFDQYIFTLKQSYRANMQEVLAKQIVKEKAPDFTLKNLKGETISLHDLKGKTVIIDFWATWCSPCKASFPAMQQLVNQNSSNKDVAFYFISTGEQGKDTDANVRKYLNTTSYTFNVLFDSPANLAAKAYSIYALPTKLVIDKEGFIRFRPNSTNDYDDMKMEMQAMINYLN